MSQKYVILASLDKSFSWLEHLLERSRTWLQKWLIRNPTTHQLIFTAWGFSYGNFGMVAMLTVKKLTDNTVFQICLILSGVDSDHSFNTNSAQLIHWKSWLWNVGINHALKDLQQTESRTLCTRFSETFIARPLRMQNCCMIGCLHHHYYIKMMLWLLWNTLYHFIEAWLKLTKTWFRIMKLFM